MQLARLTTTMRMALACALGAALAGGARPAAAQLRIVTYNTATGQPMNPATGQSARPGMANVLAAIGEELVGGIAKPIDVLLVQEQFSMAKSTQSFVDVLNDLYDPINRTMYARSTIDGAVGSSLSNGRNGLVYNTHTVSLVSEQAFGTTGTTITTQTVQSMRYALQPVGYGTDAIFYAYNDHWVSGTGATENARRLLNAQSVRSNADSLNGGVDGAHIVYAGDYNIESTSSTAYQHLLTAPGSGMAVDPLNPTNSFQSWAGNNVNWRVMHTQSPADTLRYDGQTLGGLNDRFDFQLVSQEMLDSAGMSLLAGSYHAFGNNGTTWDMDIDNPSNTYPFTGVSFTEFTRGQLLTNIASVADHLPVVADYQLPAKLGVQVAAVPSFVELNSVVSLDVTVSNTAPAVHAIGVDELAYTLGVTGSLSGSAMGTDDALGGGNLHQVTLNTSTLGLQNGMINVLATSAQTASPMFSLPVSFQVIAAFLAADFNKDGFVDATDLTAWRGGFGTASAALKSQGDADNDGDVDGGDFLTWQQQLGMAPAVMAAQSTVPEPASAALAAVAIVAAGGAARRRGPVRTRCRWISF